MNYINNDIEPYDFLNFIRHYKGQFTYYNDVQSWMNHSPALHRSQTIQEFKRNMRADSNFRPKDLRKLDDAIAEFLKSRK